MEYCGFKKESTGSCLYLFLRTCGVWVNVQTDTGGCKE